MAITSCKQSGNTSENHFACAGKMVDIWKANIYYIKEFLLKDIYKYRRVP
jgi:hypothetical protein